VIVRCLVVLGVLAAGPAVVAAQRATLPDSLFDRAQRLVNEGAGAEGRALLDSLVRVTPDGTEARATALYWRAQLAADAASAQRDFVRLTVEYALSPRAADALLGLAQLDVARGETATAQQTLERLVLEHPTSAATTEGWFWLGRVRLERGAGREGCAALDSAMARLGAQEIERRNMVEFAAQPCRSGAAFAAPPATPPAQGAATPPPARGAAAPPARAATGPQWSVQVGAFGAKADADRHAARIKARGYDVRVWNATGNRLPWRVRVGREATRAEATALVTRLKRDGFDAFVVEAEGR
jgi:cell division septation protein DedD